MKYQLPEFTKGRVLVYGDVMLDRYWYGKTSRISPEAPVPVVHVQDYQECPGGAGNVALNLIKLGATVELFGLIGNDEAGETLKNLLQHHHVQTNLVTQAGIPTTTKLRLLSANQQLVRIDFEEQMHLIHAASLVKACQASLADADLLVLSDYSKGCLSDPRALIHHANQANVPVLVDPKNLDFSVYRGATLITPNFKEFTAVVGECQDEAAILEKGYQLVQQQQLTAILVTRGEHGMILIEQDGNHLNVAAKAQEVYDVTGAGDTVVAVLAAALAVGESLHDAVRLANTAAGIVVGRLGAASVTPAQLRQTIAVQRDTGAWFVDAGVVSLETFEKVVGACHYQGENMALIVGEFDVLRWAHIQWLQQLCTEFDHIAVAIIDQKMTKTDLIHSIVARKAAIAGFVGVSWVVGVDQLSFSAILTEMPFKTVFFMPECAALIQPNVPISQQLVDLKAEVPKMI